MYGRKTGCDCRLLFFGGLIFLAVIWSNLDGIHRQLKRIAGAFEEKTEDEDEEEDVTEENEEQKGAGPLRTDHTDEPAADV